MPDTPQPENYTQIQIVLLRYLHYLLTFAGQKHVNYRQCRADVQALVSPISRKGWTGRFNWGLETQLSNDLHELATEGLLELQEGSSTVLAGRNAGRSLYSLGLTKEGESVAATLVERFGAISLPSKLDKSGGSGDDGRHNGTGNSPTSA